MKINYSKDHTAPFFQKVETEFNEVLNKSADEHLQQLKNRAEDAGASLLSDHSSDGLLID